jgi:hypothetical protein
VSNTQLSFRIFQLADAALSAMGKAKQGTTDEATKAFQHVQDEITQFGAPPPQKASGKTSWNN